MLGARGDRAEHRDVAASGPVDQSPYLARMPTQSQCQRAVAVEAQQAGHLGLAAPDQRAICAG
ncbi:MAG: hypothetical protein MUF33_15105 [Candidatus Nanopelagicales bacterium]|nr:hypothetical protein [Candidatus Nanopelagicales bacterium]